MIPVKIKDIFVDDESNFLLSLVDLEEKNVLMLGVSVWEAHSVMMTFGRNEFPRPMTHDLMNSLFRNLGAMLDKVVITDVIEDTYYAKMYLHQNGEEKVVDSRPGDAVAMALTSGTTIYITEKLFDLTINIDEMEEGNGTLHYDADYYDPDEEGPEIH